MPNNQNSADEDARIREKIGNLRGLESRDFEIWQFFEKRADDIKASLWTTATWLVALKSALLAFMLSDERIMGFNNAGLVLEPIVPTVVIVLSALGLALVFLTGAIVGDIFGHVRRNWKRASAAQNDPNLALRGNRIYVLLPLGAVEIFFAAAFSALMCLSFDGTRLHWAITVFVATAFLVSLLYTYGSLRPTPVESSTADQNEARAGGV